MRNKRTSFFILVPAVKPPFLFLPQCTPALYKMSADANVSFSGRKRKYQQEPAATPPIPCGLWCSISKSIWTLAWVWLPLCALPVSCPTNGPVPWNGSRLLYTASSNISGARNPWALSTVSTKPLVFKYISVNLYIGWAHQGR